MSLRTLISVLAMCFAAGASLSAQPTGPAVFSVDGVERTADAIDYASQDGSIDIIFAPTAEGRRGRGAAGVRAQGTGLDIEAEFVFLPDPQRFGTEYLTYVLWAISPDGRVSNLGEVQRDKRGRARLNATSDLQVFGMVITAEPYYAVPMPSDSIILENEATKKSKGRIKFINAKYELLPRGTYRPLADPLALSVNLKETPIDVYQARNALTIATAVGAREYAEDSLKMAEASLEMASSSVMKGSSKKVRTLARQAVQFAEVARARAVARQETEPPQREAEASR